MDVSVIIVSWNTRDILRECLASVYAETRGVCFEVIVIDNASTDGSPEMVKRDFPQARLVQNTHNRGFAAANNQGIALSAGRYVLLLNSDTIVLDNAISKTAAFADVNPRAAVIGCRVLNRDRTLQPTCFMYPSALNMLLSAGYMYKLFPYSRFFGRERMTWWHRDDVREVDVVTGCFMWVRREAIDHVGVMDESFFMYGEETDWCCRFRQAGWKVLFTPDANIIHLGEASSRQATHKMRLQLSGSILYFLKKHRGTPEYVLACALTAVFFLVRIPGWLLKGCIWGSERSRSWRVVRMYAAGAVGALRGYRGLCVASRHEPCSAPRPV
ncbi:MAG: hypothetical protein A2Y76_15600 [Planctomycetes bacterium RBG_13_60_9]|nr:MAG: hypothetical protein A2Y76_15600 [Planctomycetes bacterium RBG_13_60_9]